MGRPRKNPVNKNKTITFKEFHVVEIGAQVIMDEDEGDADEYYVDWSTSIEEITEDEVRIAVECRVSFEPPMRFELVGRYAVDYTHDGMTEAEIEERIDDLASPCCAKNTLIMAELSQHMQGYPLIIPAAIERDEE